MRRILACILTLALLIACLASCGLLQYYSPMAFDDISKLSGLTREDHGNYTIFKFDEFDGKATLEMERTGLGEGTIYYRADLTEGSMYVRYDTGIWDSTVDLITLSADVNLPDKNSGGYVEGDKIAIIFETQGAVSGEVIISFVPFAVH